MPYVRTRGKQLLIAHGKRHKESGDVDQRILFTFYSKDEVQRALENGSTNVRNHFRQLVESANPDITFDWKKIGVALIKNIGLLPEQYDKSQVRQVSRFRNTLCAFTRELAVLDPQENLTATEILRENLLKLRYLTSLIDWRLEMAENAKTKPSPRPEDFLWMAGHNHREVPLDVEEKIEEFFVNGEYVKARAVIDLINESFENYTEGYNYLGLIALRENKFEEAVLQFEKFIEVTRRLFPKRIAKSNYCNDFRTRSYMRGLRNLIHTLIRLGQYDNALLICDRLENECNDKLTVRTYRSSIFLNLRQWQKAFENARYTHRLYPGESFIAAIAALELGNMMKAKTYFLYGALNRPRTARLILNQKRLGTPTDMIGIEDHNGGIEMCEQITGYLNKNSKNMRRFFLAMLADSRIAALLDEVQNLEKKRDDNRKTISSDLFTKIQHMHSLKFARKKVIEFFGDGVVQKILRKKGQERTDLSH